jgi:hypothetical protein
MGVLRNSEHAQYRMVETEDYTVCEAAAQPSPQDFRINLV